MVGNWIHQPPVCHSLDQMIYWFWRKTKVHVQRIIEGQLQKNPLLQVKVGNEIEWGMLGIAISKNGPNTYAFLYYTESDGGQKVLGNRLYRYELVN